MYKYRSVHNDQLLGDIRYKLVRHNEILSDGSCLFDSIDNIGGRKFRDALTLGTGKNKKAIIGSAMIPAGAVAIGIGSAALALFCLTRQIGFDPATLDEAHRQALAQVQSAGESLGQFTVDAFGTAVKLAAIPAAVTVLSVPKKVAQILADKYDEKIIPKVTEGRQLIYLIDDIRDDVDDPSIELPKKFLYRVDITGNSKKFNMALLSHLAYYRECFKKEQDGTAKEGELNDAFMDFIRFLEESQHRVFGVSRKFKDSKMVNELINEFFEEKEEEQDYSYGEPTGFAR